MEAAPPNLGQRYIGQGKHDQTVWWSNPTHEEYVRTVEASVARGFLLPVVSQKFTKIGAFKQLISKRMATEICHQTNKKAQRVIEANSRNNATRKKEDHIRMRPWYPLTENEFYAFLGLVLYAGADKQNLVEAKDLFSKHHSLYRAAMSLERFEQILRFIRFDNNLRRPLDLATDKLASFRYMWDLFSENLISCYQPSGELCIDEQLLNTRNRCPIRQYIPSKPGKYGIKINWIVDAITNYPLVGEVYVGQQPNEARSSGLAHQLVIRIAEKWLDTGRNITMDNYFTSYPFEIELLEDRNTTIVGILRSNKRELPKTFADKDAAENRGQFASVFCFSNGAQLTSYITKKLKNVLLLSTAHATEERDLSTIAKEPKVILDYNRFKGGVDTFDQMVRGYSCKRKSCRWPVALFYNTIDVGAMAAFRLFEDGNPDWHPRTADKRKAFLKELARDLLTEHLGDRVRRSKRKMKPSVLNAIANIDFVPPAAPTTIRFQVPLGSIV